MFEIDPKFHAHPDWPRESELPTAEDVRGILPKPEPAVPLSAILALVQQLNGLGVEMGDDGAWLSNNGDKHGQQLLKYANELHRIQTDLAALCPPEE